MHGLDVLVQVGDSERLAAVRALCALVVVNLADVTRQVGHGKFFVAMRTGFLDLNKTLMLIICKLIYL